MSIQGRQLVAQINLSALKNNLQRVRECAPGAQVLAVVKADAYGHGLFRVLPALDSADGLALMECDAAIALREARYTRKILMLEGFFSQGELELFSKHRIATAVHSQEQMEMLERAQLERPLEIFLKINSGMNRLGFMPEQVKACVDRLSRMSQVAAIRLMTHLGRAETREGSATQLERFEEACHGLPYPKCIANSAGILRYNAVGGDIVRPGLMLYGASPIPNRPAAGFGLQPVMSLHSELIAIQDVPAGEFVGYGEVYRTTRHSRIGVVACGYADGYPVTAKSGTPVIVAGKRARLVGRPAMDMLMVDVTDIPEANPGSPVKLWGEDLPIEEISRASGILSYQLFTGITKRVKFMTTTLGKIDFEL